MTASPPPLPGHSALAALCGELLVAIEACATARVKVLWSSLERMLSAHFELEERTLLADLLVARPRVARVILEEHRYLRGRLAQLAQKVPNVPVESLRTFVDELRANGSHEERVLYPSHEGDAC